MPLYFYIVVAVLFCYNAIKCVLKCYKDIVAVSWQFPFRGNENILWQMHLKCFILQILSVMGVSLLLQCLFIKSL